MRAGSAPAEDAAARVGAPRPTPAAEARPVDLRVVLASIPVLAVLPLLLFAAGLMALLAESREAESRRDLVHAAQSLALAVDRELAISIRRLETLADLPQVGDDAPGAFVELAARELARNDDWHRLLLVAPDGRVLHRVPAEPAAGPVVTQPHLAEVLRTGAPVVSDVFEPPGAEPRVAVAVPVLRDGRVVRLLSARLNPKPLAERLVSDADRQGGVAVLVDRAGRVVSRSRDVERWFGRAAPPDSLERMRAAPWGTASPFDTLDGRAAVGAWARLPNGWSVALWRAEPPSMAVAEPMWILAALGLLLLAASIALSGTIARRITRIVEVAGRAAQEVAAARRPALGTPEIRQFGPLFEALDEAGDRVVDAIVRERRARAAAEAADRQKDRFLVMLGHELRNPLNAVGNAGHLLRRRDLSPGQRDGLIDMLGRQTRQLRRLVDDLLDLGRVLTGKFALHREPVAIDRLLRQSIATLGATGQLHAHTLRAELDPIRCDVDPARFEQVFANLVGNALKYTPAGGHIDVRLVGEGGDLVLSVADSGMGIDPAMRERIFELFVQGDPLDERAAGGLGVGLSMARILVEVHGGTIRAHSEGRGRGSTFVVRIPCTAAGRGAPPPRGGAPDGG